MEEGSTDLLNEAPVSLRLLLLACLLISARTTKHKRPCERHHREEMMQQYRYLKSLSLTMVSEKVRSSAVESVPQKFVPKVPKDCQNLINGNIVHCPSLCLISKSNQ